MVLIKCVLQPGQVFYGFTLVFVVMNGHSSWHNSIAHFFSSSLFQTFFLVLFCFFFNSGGFQPRASPSLLWPYSPVLPCFRNSNPKFPFYLISGTQTLNFFFTKIQIPFFRGLKPLLDELLVICYRVRLDSNLSPWSSRFEPASHRPLSEFKLILERKLPLQRALMNSPVCQQYEHLESGWSRDET